MTGRLSVGVLGTPEVRGDGRRLSFPTRKTQALLVYLAVEGGLHARDRLTALLWPESDDDHARRSLRSALVLLRGVLREALGAGSGSALVVRRDVLGIADGAAIDLDCRDLREAAGLARQTAGPPRPELLARLRAGSAAYRGDFLDGFSLGDAVDFDDWVRVQREAWHRRAERVFDRLSRELAEGGELAEAIEVTARWVAVAPLNEAAHRRLMRLHVSAGDRAGALRAYETCRAILAEQLDAPPAGETEALAAWLRTAAPPGEVESEEPGIPPIAAEGPLVGRLAEHARLVAAYRTARQGRPQAVAIEGEAGIGKTRLVRGFLRWAAAQRADLLSARAFETGGRLPYQPLADALRTRLERENAPDDLLGDAWLAELTRLLPELRDRYPDLPAPARDEATARTRLFGGLARLIQALAARAPVVLWLDDAQWADTASLDVLRYAAGRWAEAGAPILLIAGLRAEDLDATPALAEWLTGLGRELPLARLRLGPLTRADTDRLLDLAAGRRSPAEADRPDDAASPELDALGRWLFAETGGHPFFVIETLKSLIERGILQVAGTAATAQMLDSPLIDAAPRDSSVAAAVPSRLIDAAPRDSSVAAGVPSPLVDAAQVDSSVAPGVPSPVVDMARLAGFVAPGVHELLRSRFLRLSQAARAELFAAAVLGDGFEVERLREVVELGENEALAALDELLTGRLLRESRGRYLFGHDKIREIAYREAGEARRRLYHRRALDRLTASGEPPAELARHAFAAALPERAFRLSVAAGDAALRLFAAPDAIRHYERARDDVPRLANVGDWHVGAVELDNLRLPLGRAYELVADYAAARREYDAVLASARDRGDRRIECAALNRLAGLAATDQLDLRAQAALLESARAAAEAGGDTAGLAETEWNLARHCLFRLDLDRSLAHAERALTLGRQLASTEQVARALNWLALTELMLARWPRAEAHAEEARVACLALGDRALEADCLAKLASARIRSGRTAEGIADARAALAIGQATENAWAQADAALELALGLAERGEYGQALAVARAGVAAARSAGYAPLLIMCSAMLGGVYRRTGQIKAACATLGQAWAAAEAVQSPLFTELIAVELCALHAVLGEWPEAHTYARRALAARSSHPAAYTGLTRWHETEAVVQAGEIADAADDVRRFGERIADGQRYRVAYLRAEAVLAAARAEPDRAEALLGEARALAHALDLPGELWPIEGALAELSARRGALVEAEAAWTSAAQTIERLAQTLPDDAAGAAFRAMPPVRRVLDRLS